MIEVTDEDVQAVEAIIGMGSGAWDCVDPKEIIAAAYEVMQVEDGELLRMRSSAPDLSKMGVELVRENGGSEIRHKGV